jgi:hypothetical protein
MAITGGFGFTMDLKRGTSRQWVMGRDGVQRWADDGTPTDGSCSECGAKDADQAATMCICSGEKDDCHGQYLWPDE